MSMRSSVYPSKKCQVVVFPRGAEGEDFVLIGNAEASDKGISVHELVDVVVEAQ